MMIVIVKLAYTPDHADPGRDTGYQKEPNDYDQALRIGFLWIRKTGIASS